MSIQPNRVLARIVEQVDRSDWPELEGTLFAMPRERVTLRFYAHRAHPRYATPIHFWVHALREELVARARRPDLVGAAGHALCRNQPILEWRREVECALSGAPAQGSSRLCLAERLGPQPQAYRMLESVCRRSSVVDTGDWLMAHFWNHGSAESWRREANR